MLLVLWPDEMEGRETTLLHYFNLELYFQELFSSDRPASKGWVPFLVATRIMCQV